MDEININIPDTIFQNIFKEEALSLFRLLDKVDNNKLYKIENIKIKNLVKHYFNKNIFIIWCYENIKTFNYDITSTFKDKDPECSFELNIHISINVKNINDMLLLKLKWF